MIHPKKLNIFYVKPIPEIITGNSGKIPGNAAFFPENFRTETPSEPSPFPLPPAGLCTPAPAPSLPLCPRTCTLLSPAEKSAGHAPIPSCNFPPDTLYSKKDNAGERGDPSGLGLCTLYRENRSSRNCIPKLNCPRPALLLLFPILTDILEEDFADDGKYTIVIYRREK